jgi:outer membrane protein
MFAIIHNVFTEVSQLFVNVNNGVSPISQEINQTEEMMKNIVLKGILVLSLFVFAASPALASDVSMKIGIVDLKKAVTGSEQGKKAKAELEAFAKSKQGALDEMGTNIEKLKTDLDKQVDVISAAATKNKQDELERRTREYQRTVADSQGEVGKKENELIRGILVGLREIIQVIAAEDRYTLILENNEAVVVFADKAIDITDKLIKRYDESQQKSSKK